MRELLMPYGGSGIRRLLMAHALKGQQLVEQTATGNPATFTATAAKPLIQCQAAFSPIQSGSGDPSPENVRPITGWTGVNVYHSGEDISDPTMYPVMFPAQAGTVYGGYVDLSTGEVWATYGFSSDSWGNMALRSVKTDYTCKLMTLSNAYNNNGGTGTGNVCRKNYSDNYTFTHFYIASNDAYIFMPNDTSNDLQVDICYQLATPTLVATLTPQQITALVGTNNIWSDADGDMTIKYLTKGA